MGDLEEDIFGADSGDEKNSPNLETLAPSSFANSDKFDLDDDLFGDSGDEGTEKKKKKLGKQGKLKKIPKKVVANEDNIADSDDDIFDRPKKDRLSKKDKKLLKNTSKEEKLKKKRKREIKDESSNGTTEKKESHGESSDEYDSQEIEENEDDRNFMDKDDDLGHITKEYDEDLQDFNDERPKKKKTAVGGSESRSKETDPLSITLNEVRKPKVKQLNDQEKEEIIDKLFKKMEVATKKDDLCVQKSQPAVHKLSLLPAVQAVVSMKPLHSTLLDKDFLCYLRDWIKPRNEETLPALSLRTAVYDMLLKLPCMVDHLKRGQGEDPIGHIIVRLRKHRLETPENKRILKEIMDKWSRPIFARSEEDSQTRNEEIEVAAYRKMLSRLEEADQLKKAELSFATRGDSKKNEGESNERARIPMNQGYVFTVRPESIDVSKGNIMEKALGEEKMKIYKKLTEGGKASATGKKENTRAMSISISTGTKH